MAIVGLLLAPVEAGPPALLAEARYVALGYDHGAGFVSETDVRQDVLDEEREALQRIRSGLEQWDRYVIVVRPEQADLLIAIRKGRRASFGGGVSIGGPSSGRPAAARRDRSDGRGPGLLARRHDRGLRAERTRSSGAG